MVFSYHYFFWGEPQKNRSAPRFLLKKNNKWKELFSLWIHNEKKLRYSENTYTVTKPKINPKIPFFGLVFKSNIVFGHIYFGGKVETYDISILVEKVESYGKSILVRKVEKYGIFILVFEFFLCTF